MCTKCAPSVHQVCTRCAPGVHYLGVHHAFTVHQVCTRCAPGVHQVCTGVCTGVCTRCAKLHYQIADPGSAFHECTVIMDCCQSSYVCSTNFARVAMVTIKKARAGSLLLNCFSDVIFSCFHTLFTKQMRPKSKF